MWRTVASHHEVRKDDAFGPWIVPVTSRGGLRRLARPVVLHAAVVCGDGRELRVPHRGPAGSSTEQALTTWLGHRPTD